MRIGCHARSSLIEGRGSAGGGLLYIRKGEWQLLLTPFSSTQHSILYHTLFVLLYQTFDDPEPLSPFHCHGFTFEFDRLGHLQLQPLHYSDLSSLLSLCQVLPHSPWQCPIPRYLLPASVHPGVFGHPLSHMGIHDRPPFRSARRNHRLRRASADALQHLGLQPIPNVSRVNPAQRFIPSKQFERSLTT